MNKAVVRKKQQYINHNIIESSRNIGSGVVSDMLSQVFDSTVDEKSQRQEVGGDLVEGREVTLSRLAQKQKVSEEKFPALNIEPGIDYRREIIHGERKILQRQTQEIAAKIQEIIIELKRLTTSSKELQVQFKEVSVAQVPNPGKYHQTFFEWMLIVIKQARMKVEDSGAWLAAAKSKNAKKQYWSMFKKHGTSFGLSNERVVATQTG